MTRSATILLASLLLAAACGKKDESSSSPKTTDKAPPTPAEPVAAAKPAPTAKQPITPELFGKSPAPIGPLAKLTWGMSAEDARKAAPALVPKKDGGYDAWTDPSLDGVRYGVGLDKDTNRVNRMNISLPANAKEVLEKAWGPGKPAKDTIGRPRTYWFDPANHWRAYLEPGFGDDVSLELSPYVSAEELLAQSYQTFGAPDGMLEATLPELRTRFGEKLIETDAAKAAEQQKQLSQFTGKDLDKAVGKAKPSVRVELPPTEWESYWTRIQIDWSDAGKVSDIWFQVPYEAYEPAKEELRALFEKNWGKPKPGKYIVSKVDVYRAKNPWIAVEDDTIMHAWTVRIHAKPPNH
jgi:hypothetical protein